MTLKKIEGIGAAQRKISDFALYFAGLIALRPTFFSLPFKYRNLNYYIYPQA